MDYLKIHEVSEKWGISPRRLQVLCAEGRIEGAIRFGKAWMIPKNAVKPADGRTKSSRDLAAAPVNQPMPRKTPFLYMSDLYSRPGSAEESIASLAGNSEAYTLFAAEVAYSRGQIDQVYSHARYLLHQHTGFYAVLSAGMLLALCAIWRGDLALWRQAKIHIAEAPAASDQDRDIITLALTAVDSILYDVSAFPEWFKIGRFEPLHKDALPAAKVFYAKYLYASAYAVATKQYNLQGVQGLSLMAMLPNTVEPMISQAMADHSIMAEMYLRMICAVIYHTCDNDEQAVYHLDRAIALALPDRLYGFLAEYGRTLGPLLAQRLSQIDPQIWKEVQQLYQTYNEGWSRLSGSVRGRTIYTTLSPKEREVAKLAAFGMRNGEIAEKLHMSVSGVKQAITNVTLKTGMSREEFAAIL